MSGGAGGGATAEATFNQGVILWNAGKFAEAKEQFEAAVKADPNMAMAHYQLGMANLNLGQIPQAREAFEGYLKADPNGPKAAEVKAFLSAAAEVSRGRSAAQRKFVARGLQPPRCFSGPRPPDVHLRSADRGPRANCRRGPLGRPGSRLHSAYRRLQDLSTRPHPRGLCGRATGLR